MKIGISRLLKQERTTFSMTGAVIHGVTEIGPLCEVGLRTEPEDKKETYFYLQMVIS
jgi:hypothetical protein